METKEEKSQWKDLIGHAAEQAPQGFADRVMALLEQEERVQVSVRPLISRRTWFVIGVWVISLMAAGLYFWNGEDLSGMGIVNAYIPEVNFDLGSVAGLPELSNTFAWCGIALLIFAGLHMRWMYRHINQNLTV